MNEISNVNEGNISVRRLINIERIDDYIFIETSEGSFLIDQNKKVYSLGKCLHVDKVHHMGDDIMGVLHRNYKQELVDLNTNEVIVSQDISACTGIFKVDDDYVELLSYNHKPQLFNVRKKCYIKPDLGIEVEYARKVGPGLFVFENNDYSKGIYKHFVVDDEGKLVYDCGAYFPYFADGTLVLSALRDHEVVIIRNVLEGNREIEYISQNEMVHSNPLVHEGDNNVADAICFVSGSDFVIADLSMNIKKKYPLDIEYDKVEIQLWGDIAVVIVTKGDDATCVALNIKTGVTIKHHGIWVLPLDVIGPVVIRGCDKVGEKDYVFTIYDENGSEYTHHHASDCFNIHTEKMNLIKFANVDHMDKTVVYDVEKKEEKEIPWMEPEFRTDRDGKYLPIGFGIRYGENWQDEIIDFFDEDLNVVMEGLKARDYKINTNDFAYELRNNLLLLIIPKSNGPRTFYRRLVMNKNGKVIHDSYDNQISFIGNFLQIIDEENAKTYYIDSRDERVLDNVVLPSDIPIPDTLEVDGKIVKLIKEKGIETDE